MTSSDHNMPIVRLTQVQKHYKVGATVVKALNGIDLRIHAREFWAIMGPSGSGKSTLLNLLGCMDRPTAGSYHLGGQNISALDDDALSNIRLRKLGFIFQSFNLIPQLTVQENIELPLFYMGWETANSAQRAAELAEKVGLGDRLHHRPMELSGGQQQRVAIARALANDPSVLLADEPTGNLDSNTGKQIMELLTQLNQSNKIIIMVTHEPEIAAYAAFRMHMRDGVIDRVEKQHA